MRIKNFRLRFLAAIFFLIAAKNLNKIWKDMEDMESSNIVITSDHIFNWKKIFLLTLFFN